MKPIVWWQGGDGPHIVTRNSDGGTTGWTIADAKKLHQTLGEILTAYGGDDGPEAVKSASKGTAP